MRRKLALAVVTGLLALPSVAAAATRYASPTGTTGDPCTQAQPCDIATALDKVGQPNDEVIVLPGTYDIAFNGLTTQAGMNVHGQDGSPRPVINNTSTIGLAATGSNSTVRYLKITATGANPSGGGTALDVQNGSTAENVIAEGLTTHQAGGCETEGGAGGTATIVDSVCKADGTAPAVNVGDPDGHYNTTTLRNVTALSASGDGIFASETNTGGTSVTVDVVNTIARGGSNDLHVAHSGDSVANVYIASSNFSSVLETAPFANVNDQGHNQSAAPQLTSDWHEMPGSPTIDAGTNDPANGSTDFDGEPRTLGSGTTDIGADEYVPAPLVTTGDPTAVGMTTGTLNGTVNPESRGTTYHFDFGTSTSYGSSTPETGVGSGTSSIAVNATLTPIVPGTTYHYRIVATNNVGTSFGVDKQFTTAALPVVTPNLELAPVPFKGLTLKSRTVTVDKNGNAVVEVSCPATAVGNCVGTDTLNTASKVTVKLVAARKKKAKILKLGSAKFSIAPGKKLKLKINLSKQARSLLAKKKKLRAVETVVAHDSRNVSKTTKANLTLKAPKAKKRKKH